MDPGHIPAFVILVIANLGGSLGYITGAPKEQCDRMTPGHGSDPQPAGSTPYTLTVSSPTFRCKQDITVTLNGTSPFKGFLCQVRTDINTYGGVGKLTSAGTITTSNNCAGNDASLTHTSNDEKTSVVFNWRSNENVTEVYFVCTIVQKYDTFWLKQNAPAVKYEEGGDCSSDDDDGTDSSNQIAPSILALFLVYLVRFGLL